MHFPDQTHLPYLSLSTLGRLVHPQSCFSVTIAQDHDKQAVINNQFVYFYATGIYT